MIACMAVIVGFQLTAFAFYTKIFAIAEGYLPEDPKLNRLFRYFTLERGIIVSFLVWLVGISLLVRATWLWSQKDFGQLPWDENLRRIIPGSTLVLLGTQSFFSSFFLSILGLRTTRTAHLQHVSSMTWLDKYLQRCRIKEVQPFLSNGDRVLDVGSSDGVLFETLSFLGPNCIGIDPTLKEAIDDKKFRLIPGFFPQDMADVGQFDVVTMLAVLEHFPESHIGQVVAGCHRFLKPGGKVIITVPSPRVDQILAILKKLRLVRGMALEEHHGYVVEHTAEIFCDPHFKPICHRKFQLGLNNLFVFERIGGTK